MTKFDQLYNAILEEQNMLNEGKLTNSLLAGAAGLAMTGATVLGLNGLPKLDSALKDKPPVRYLTVTKSPANDIPKEPEVKYVPKKQVKQQLSENWINDVALPFIISWEGKILNKNGQHVLYDDNVTAKRRKVWDGKGGQAGIDRFIKNCVGKPCIGYGNNDINVARKGTLSESEARADLLKRIIELNNILAKRHARVWPKMNANQRTALISFYYNLGEYFNAPKMVRNLNAGRFAEAANEMLDCDNVSTKSGLVKVPGLTKRRAAEAKLMTSR